MADITPRTAILEFAAAHSSTMETPSKYFSAPQSALTSGAAVDTKDKENEENIEYTDGAEGSLVEDSPSSPRPLVRGRRRSSGPRVREEEMDPDRDITRPTDMSGPNNSASSASDDSIGNETMKVVQNIRARRSKRRGNRSPIDENAFNITLHPRDMPKVHGITEDTIEDESTLEMETRSKRRKARTNKDLVTTKDFEDIEPPQEIHENYVDAGDKNIVDHGISKKSREESETELLSDEEETYVAVRRTKSKKRDQMIDTAEFEGISVNIPVAEECFGLENEGTGKTEDHESEKRTNQADTEEGEAKKTPTDTTQELDDSEETPVKVIVRNNRRPGFDTNDFEGISLNISHTTATSLESGFIPNQSAVMAAVSNREATEQDDVTAVGEEVETGGTAGRGAGVADQPGFSPTSNPTELLPGEAVRIAIETLNHEVPELTDERQLEERSLKSLRRKSVVIGGLPSLPVDRTMMMEETVAFRPNVESTRLGGDSSNLTELGTASPEVAASQKPGQDASTPVHLASLGNTRQSRKSKSIAATEDGTQYGTPELMREERRQTRHSLRPSLSQYHTRLEAQEIEEGGTQTTPGLTELLAVPVVETVGTAAQVTPSLITAAEVETEYQKEKSSYHEEIDNKGNDRSETYDKVTNELNEINGNAIEQEEEQNEDIADDIDIPYENEEHYDDDAMDGQQEGRTMENDEFETTGAVALPSVDTRTLPSNTERKAMRQATIARYFGNGNATGSLGLSKLLSPVEGKENQKKEAAPVKKKTAPKKKLKGPVFPLKNVKFEYHRFSRFKVKKEAESSLMDASTAFVDLLLSQEVSSIAKQRGASKIELCDQRRFAGEWGPFKIQTVEEDPSNKEFFPFVRNLVREELAAKLIPCHVGRGKVDPPEDIWDEKKVKKTKSKYRKK